MKFSWKWLNQFIKLNNINIDQLSNKLTLAGFEVDTIDEIKKTQDIIIDISITPNRSDISSIIGLSREISTILNQDIIQQSIYNSLYQRNIQNKFTYINKNIKYINLIQVHKFNNYQSPKWIKNFLYSYKIKPVSLLSDIIEYIKLKWNYNIYVSNSPITQNKKIQDFSLNHNEYRITHQNILKKHKNDQLVNQNIIIYSFAYHNANTSTSYHDFNQSYNEAINLIQTYSQAIIGKLYKSSNINNKTYKYIYVNKNKINDTLGPSITKKNKFLSIIEISQILQRLNWSYNYNKKDKNFKIYIPEHRIHDINRDIDIIEEISRIHGFQYFYQNLSKIIHNNKGKLDKSTSKINYIRHILRNLGLHETLNSSFTNPIHINGIQKKTTHITLHNPMNEYQALLRNNLLENLITNYTHNYKQKNIQCELFEIGTTFTCNLSNEHNFNEQMHIAAILSNSIFSRISWQEKPKEMTWFHAKGLIEEFFQKINASITWKVYKEFNTHTFLINHKNIFNPLRTILIYDKYKDIPMGIFGQINKQVLKKLNIDDYRNTNIYAFEINLYQLINTIKQKNHLQYIIKQYSTYPSITRDISFNITQYENLDNIILNIKNINREVIESVHILNEYYNKANNNRYICLRIVYRSKYKTLQTEEIENINLYITNNIIN